jgi:hypothetical protein
VSIEGFWHGKSPPGRVTVRFPPLMSLCSMTPEVIHHNTSLIALEYDIPNSHPNAFFSARSRCRGVPVTSFCHALETIGRKPSFRCTPPALPLICCHPVPSTPFVSCPASLSLPRDSAVSAQGAGRAGTCLLCIWRRCSFRPLSTGIPVHGIHRGRRRPLRSLGCVSG